MFITINWNFTFQQTQAQHSGSAKSVTPKCLVSPEGSVNCSKMVFRDSNEWRISRREIEQQIREMRMQLETLKVQFYFQSFPIFNALNFKYLHFLFRTRIFLFWRLKQRACFQSVAQLGWVEGGLQPFPIEILEAYIPASCF